MTAIIKTEFQKMKRYHILLIALIGMFCSPLLQLFSQYAMNDALKDLIMILPHCWKVPYGEMLRYFCQL